MRKFFALIVSLTFLLSLAFPLYTRDRMMLTDFSVQEILLILKNEYLKPSCRNYDLKSTAERTYNILKTRGRGAVYAPIDCYGLVVEFENNGSDTLDVRVRNIAKPD
ncbi:MAG: hypothetical protein ABIN18_25595 [Pseudomonadota bacterium]